MPRDLPLRHSEQLLALLSLDQWEFQSKDLPPPARVTIKVTDGPLLGQQFVFEERTTAILGRDDDCSPRLRRCAACGRDVAGEAGANRQGEFLCAACRIKPEQLLQERTMARDVPAIEGYTILKKLGAGGMGTVVPTRSVGTRGISLYSCLKMERIIRDRMPGPSWGTSAFRCPGGSAVVPAL